MNLPSRFEAFVTKHELLDSARPVVVGVSGGLDSTVLLHLLLEAGFEAVGAHVNYGLRGDDAAADEAFVRALCAVHGVPFVVAHPDLESGNTQAVAREARYAFFRRVAEKVGADAVAVAHHRDDQAETLLLNLVRGAGPVGLAGMPRRRRLGPASTVELVRPLLFASRDDLHAYATARAIDWREDATNRVSDYRRTALRTEVLPAIDALFPGAADRLAESAERLRAYLDSGAPLAAGPDLDALAEPLIDGWAVSVGAIQSHPDVLRHGLWIEALRRWGPEVPRSAATARELDALLGAQSGRRVEWPGLTVVRDRDRIVFMRVRPANEETVAVSLGTTHTDGGTLSLTMEERPDTLGGSHLVEYVDADRLDFPLMLRPWSAGDRFIPLGMSGSKKVSDLLTDRAVPSHARAHERVLVCGERIVWVVGHRLAEPFRLRPETGRVICMRWHPAKAVDGEGGAG